MKFNLEITFSKLFSFLLLGTATAVSIILKDAGPFTISLPIVAGIITNKQYQDRKNKECEKTGMIKS